MVQPYQRYTHVDWLGLKIQKKGWTLIRHPWPNPGQRCERAIWSRGQQSEAGLGVGGVLVALPPLLKTSKAPLKQVFSILYHTLCLSFFPHITITGCPSSALFFPLFVFFSPTFSMFLLFCLYSVFLSISLSSACVSGFVWLALSSLWFGGCCGIGRIGRVY